MLGCPKQAKSVWKDFVIGSDIDQSKVRPDILNSWQRCRGKVDPFQKKNQVVLSPEELKRLKKEKSDLLKIALPVMDNLYRFVRGSGFVVALADEKGCILEIVGDPEAIELVSRANFVPGANWSEEVMGTNAVGTALILDKPIQVQAYEHWSVCVHVGTCSAANIHDPDTGEILGVLDMTGSYEKVHSHTLGMVVAAIGTIEGQIAASHANQYKTLIMECISDGLIVIDERKVITHINQKAIDIFGFKENPMGQNIMFLLKKNFGVLENCRDLVHIIKDKEKVSDEFVHIQTSNRVLRCMVTTRCLHSDKAVIGKILAIQGVSRVNKLVTHTFGNSARFTFANLISKDKKFLECIEMGIQVSKTDSNILLLGESGTGKDLFAQAIHNASSRRNHPYLAINCAAIPRDLLGSELFGFVEGAFTGAKKGGNTGKFELADEGTVFLDEIGEMPLDMQTVLLRVIEERAVTRLGGKKAIPVNVRIISASNKDLAREVEKGNFRADLFYRLNVVSITMTPLRERKGDIPQLISYFIEKISAGMGKRIESIDDEVFKACTAYDWPGNVRELQNVIERGVNLSKGPVFSLALLPNQLKQFYAKTDARYKNNMRTLISTRKSAEQDLIFTYLNKYKGNISMVAKELGVARSTVYRKLKDGKK